jgi:hypothetical protein
MLLVRNIICPKSVPRYIFNFGCLSSGHGIYVSKEMRIRACFSKTKGVREEGILGNTGLIDLNNEIMVILCNLVQ